MVSQFDAIILGAGAAGLFCAATAGQRGKRVLLLDHNAEVGRKILISGGGRCNFTNLHTAPDRYLSANPHFAKSALARYTPADFLKLVESYGIAWHEKTLGQLFCDGSAKQIVALLLEECAKGGVTLRLGGETGAVEHRDGQFHVAGASAPALVIATGGPSIPKLGATQFAYELARQFGLKVVQPRPALVPLTLSGDDALFTELSGVATEVVARCGKTAFREAALFTHRGLSGPAILQVSSYWQRGEDVRIDYLPDQPLGWLLEAKRTQPRSALRRVLPLPERLATTLAERLGVAGELGNQSDKVLRAAEATLHDWHFHPTGSEGFAKAEVTAGGISTAELSSQTMEAKKVPGLYAIGEAVDVTGWLGGYNFQWAWASGFAAGQAL
ncbi:NAD(P)/FAD-dependent oxidoreductase [Novosphingobium sp.]|uniref:NAD(P)/FAD-dependent oxidoreductase n=1 Tax=Novosphingobium sp. TaxID=1874826 RepID=UPI0022C01F2E|nr:NAD(P)/FAD-dependent oxidoreductase [Novosphingobium sp.]MCZ8018719.1 NAD(P)/FAD-dependent oxidoreductase [Novosphingobium sp.]MCZ8034724.1 NAD(P)/FAD-dependent oxidoreductase [Novosphingobium sp.]MCZ8052859.1 NAD(P)/FAD-dependent oxidoreductase [Novosphingobium sp.]MCZ8060617.1 NAD(P)/FAD-dependent oxidoreductase [Novosphingobium sp.]MCZ8230643.1 NAD(P)/FAD-dependent oxidoreductase [Novosphingobium sp.]